MTRAPKNPKEASRKPSVVTELRRLTPLRPLSFAEGRQLAGLQAERLLTLTKATAGPFSEAIITELPRIEVRRSASLIASGATGWSRGRWHIRLNGSEPLTRQRFTLAHEFKHILDAASEDTIYGHLPAGRTRERHVEAICDHFAACLLMPKERIKLLWSETPGDVAGMAWRFEVSQQAMYIRLLNLGLVDPMPRHLTAYRLGRVAVHGSGRRGRPTDRPARPYLRLGRRSLAPTSEPVIGSFDLADRLQRRTSLKNELTTTGKAIVP